MMTNKGRDTIVSSLKKVLCPGWAFRRKPPFCQELEEGSCLLKRASFSLSLAKGACGSSTNTLLSRNISRAIWSLSLSSQAHFLLVPFTLKIFPLSLLLAFPGGSLSVWNKLFLFSPTEQLFWFLYCIHFHSTITCSVYHFQVEKASSLRNKGHG